MSLEIGEMVAGYTILRLLGVGGMGEVYLAQHPRLPRQDALKVLRREGSLDDGFRTRFIQEADLAARMSHPNIVVVHDRGEFGGQLWIASQYVDGIDAAHLLSQSYPDGLPADLAVGIIRAIAGALDYAHQRDLLHRDVKPANILLSHPDRDGQRHAYLADFGIARTLAEANGLTATNMTLGTVAYSAPEQLLGELVSDRADQYSLAATAYHLLTGSALYPSTNAAVVINHQLNTPAPSVDKYRPELSRLNAVLQIALAKRADDRFRRCSDFAQALADQIDSAKESAHTETTIAPISLTAGAASDASTAESARQGRTTFRAKILIAAATAAVVVAGGVALAWQAPQSADADQVGPKETPAAVVESAPEPATAYAMAEAIKAAVPEITGLIALNEENDTNNLIGRPNGYTAATVLVDSRATCNTQSPGASCGAKIEQWPDAAAAQRRADYIQQILTSTPMLGAEWSTVKGNLLLRVGGELPPSAAKQYESAFQVDATKTAELTPEPNSKEALEIRAHQLDILATQGNAAEAYTFYSQRCKNTIGDLSAYKAVLNQWLDGREPRYSGVAVSIKGSSAQVVSIDNDPDAPVSSMDPRTWTFIDGAWQFDNC